MTVYLITPPDKMVVWAGLQRLWLGCLLRIITRGVPTEKNPVLFLVDECAHIGQMQALEDAVTLMRGMGIRLWLFFQSIEQLKKCFGDNAGTVLDNLATQQYFSITSYETAEAMSKRIGDETIVIRTEGDNRGTSTPIGGDGKNPGSRNSGSNTNYFGSRPPAAQARGNPGAAGACRHRLPQEQLCDRLRQNQVLCRPGVPPPGHHLPPVGHRPHAGAGPGRHGLGLAHWRWLGGDGVRRQPAGAGPAARCRRVAGILRGLGRLRLHRPPYQAAGRRPLPYRPRPGGFSRVTRPGARKGAGNHVSGLTHERGFTWRKTTSVSQ